MPEHSLTTPSNRPFSVSYDCLIFYNLTNSFLSDIDETIRGGLHGKADRLRPGEYRRADPQLQLDALNKAGCAEIFTDKASGTRGSRPGLDACLAALEPGDTLVVWRLDRLGRSMPHLVGLVEELLGKLPGVGLWMRSSFRSSPSGLRITKLV